MKKLYIPIIGAILSAIAFQLANTSGTFGVFYNSFFPCVQDPALSAPCYVGVDVGVMVLSSIIFIICVIFVAVRILKNK